MDMRIKHFRWLIAAPIAALLACLGCASGKKPVAVLPVFQGPPKIQQAAPVTGKPSATSQPTVSTVSAAKPEVKPAAPKPDPIADLIAKVESEYQAGLELYNSGQKDGAKEHFDRAFNMLLGSPTEIRSNLRFQPEFDRVMEGVSKLEFDAMQQGDSAAEQQKSEPAPIDEANEVTNYPVDPNLKAQAAAEIKSTHSDLPEMIERTLKQEGVPQDLIYLAQAESGFHPYAVSRAGARGIWQFMGSRARAYDLHRDAWVDERQDPEKSTRAAARHLKDLYNQFGDWYLAMAAYNSGPGTVQSAVKRTGYADFWELYSRNVLPRETKNYVPVILAAAIMAKNPGQYGLDAMTFDPAILTDNVN